MTVATTDRPRVHNELEPVHPPGESRGALGPMAPMGLVGLAALAAALPGCGGGESEVEALADVDGRANVLAADGGEGLALAAAMSTITREEASRFLSQAGMGGTAVDIMQVQASGSFDAWLTTQFNTAPTKGYVKLISPGGEDRDRNGESPNAGGKFAVQRAMWRKFITGPDVLRQRVTLALSEIFVISVSGVQGGNMDILEGNAFGNLRGLLEQVSTSAAMGTFLTFQNNKKANTLTGSQPDENYARELMQLFTIGLVELNLDGTPVLVNGAPVETYTQDDVAGLARVFTGWDFNTDRNPETDRATKPMVQEENSHEPGAKTFLNYTIGQGTDGANSLKLAINRLMEHPNMGPFLGRQLIQRLVKSNPSPGYVARVATAFNGSSPATKGDLKATLRAVLLDTEARAPEAQGTKNGKLREPMLRFMHWARIAQLLPSNKKRYDMGDLSSAAFALGQSPLQSPSVFNFFRPAYVPPGGQLAALGITAPEFQITNESSVAGYLNFMQKVVANGVSGSLPDYTAFKDLVAKPSSADLLKELNVLLAAGQVSPATLARLATAVDTIPPTSDKNRQNRMHAAVLLMLCAPEYLVQK
jgi:uncharacterized protein (DUF1800 family)